MKSISSTQDDTRITTLTSLGHVLHQNQDHDQDSPPRKISNPASGITQDSDDKLIEKAGKLICTSDWRIDPRKDDKNDLSDNRRSEG